MDIQSFYHLTPDEFEVIYKKWSEVRDSDFKNGWDQLRIISYQVYLSNQLLKNKKAMTAFMPFPWDKNKKAGIAKSKNIRDHKRFERLKNEYGENI